MHNSPNRGVNYHIFQNKGNYPVIIIYDLDYLSSDCEELFRWRVTVTFEYFIEGI